MAVGGRLSLHVHPAGYAARSTSHRPGAPVHPGVCTASTRRGDCAAMHGPVALHWERYGHGGTIAVVIKRHAPAQHRYCHAWLTPVVHTHACACAVPQCRAFRLIAHRQARGAVAGVFPLLPEAVSAWTRPLCGRWHAQASPRRRKSRCAATAGSAVAIQHARAAVQAFVRPCRCEPRPQAGAHESTAAQTPARTRRGAFKTRNTAAADGAAGAPQRRSGHRSGRTAVRSAASSCARRAGPPRRLRPPAALA